MVLGKAPDALSQRRGASACDPLRWGPAQPLLTASGQEVYVELIHSARLGQRIVLFGDPVVVLLRSPNSGVFRPPRVQWVAGLLLDHRFRAHPIHLPPGFEQFIAPRVVTHPPGSVDVVWGSSSDTNNSPASHVSALWHARYDGDKWSTPELLVRAGEIHWRAPTFAAAVRQGRRLHVVAPYYERATQDAGVLHIDGTTGAFSATRIRQRALPGYATITGENDGSLLVTFVESELDSLPNGGHLYAIRSTDGGRTWSRPQLVHWSGAGMVRDVTILRGTPETVLVWAEVSKGAFYPDSFRIARTVDHGRHWTEFAALSAGGEFVGLQARDDRSSMVQVVMQLIGDTSSLKYFRADGHGTIDSLTLARDVSSLPRLIAVSPDTTMLIWGQHIRLASESKRARAQFALRTRCPSPSR